MTFDDALAALLTLIGERVDIAIESPAGLMVAHFSGTLARGHDLSPRDDDMLAPVMFSLDEDGGAGFILDPRGFVAAEWSLDGELLRVEDRSRLAILVERASMAAG